MKPLRVGAPGYERPVVQVTALEPGDLINTGTPAGVALSGRFPYLAAGDTVEMEIEGLGRQRRPDTAVT